MALASSRVLGFVTPRGGGMATPRGCVTARPAFPGTSVVTPRMAGSWVGAGEMSEMGKVAGAGEGVMQSRTPTVGAPPHAAGSMTARAVMGLHGRCGGMCG